MPNENEKSQNNISSEKIGYTMKTMESDLKNENFSSSSFNLSKAQPIKQEEKKKPEKIEKISDKKAPLNPFLKNLQRPENNIYATAPKKPEETKKTSPLASQKSKPSLKPASPILEKSAGEGTSVNNKLLIVLFFISLTAVGAGFYYFYFGKEQGAAETSVKETPPELIPPELVTPAKADLPQKLKESASLSIEEQGLASSVLGEKSSLVNSTGEYYQIKQTDKLLSSSDFLSLLEIQFPAEVLDEFEESWTFLYLQDDVLKMNLILKLKESSVQTKSFLKNNEYRFPGLVKPLFIDESFVLQDEQVSFQESGLASDLKYYNLTDNSGSKSIDWVIVDDKYLIIATSKESALKLIEDLKK